MTTLEIIIAELNRQHEDKNGDLTLLRIDEPGIALIDGDVDLVAVAAAIDKEKGAVPWLRIS
jgi:hypothetical protein